MFDFDGNDEFDAKDAAIIGGAVGFVEESLRNENVTFEENDDGEVDVDPKMLNSNDLRIAYNTDPHLFKYIVNIIIKQKKKWKERREWLESLSEDSLHELRAIEKTEKMLENLGEQE